MIAPGAGAKTWSVYPNHSGPTPTIQSAIDSCAVSGDNIIVYAGIHYEGNIVSDGKSITIDQSGQAYIHSPTPGSGTGITIRNASSFTISSLAFRNFGTAVAVESANPLIQWVTIRACGSGLTVSGISSCPVMWYALVDSCGTGIDVIEGGAITLRNQTIANCATGVRFASATTTFTRNIVYHCGVGIQCAGGIVNQSCSNFFLNAADYGGCSAGTNDFFTDPMFCFWKAPAPGPYWLHNTSPCLTGTNPCGQKVGAFTAAAGCTGTGAEHTTWGAIKGIYR